MAILPSAADASVDTVKIYVNGVLSTPTIPPKIIHNRIWIPVRVLSKILNQHIQWNQASKALVTTKSSKKVELRLSKGVTYLNGDPVDADLSIQNWQGKIYIPVRLLPYLFDASISWNQASRTLNILSDPTDGTVPALSSELRNKLNVLGLPEGISIVEYSLSRSGVPNDSSLPERQNLEGIALTLTVQNNRKEAVESQDLLYTVSKSLHLTPDDSGTLTDNKKSVSIQPNGRATFMISSTAYANEQIQIRLSDASDDLN